MPRGTRGSRLVVQTLTEVWSESMLKRAQELRAVLNPMHHDQPILKQLATLEPGPRCVDYCRGKGIGTELNIGRIYAPKSIQGLTAKSKHYILHDELQDIDIRNAHPTILSQIAARYSIKLPTLTDYVTDRDAVTAKIIREFPELTPSDVKQAFIVSVFGGNHIKLATNIFVPEVAAFRRELQILANTLQTLPEFETIWNQVQTEHENDTGQLAYKLISWVCQKAEEDIVNAISTFIQQHGVAVRGNMFDGLLIDRQSQPIDRLLLESSAFAEQQTGYSIQLVEKPMIPPLITDMQKRATVEQAGILPTDKVILFDFDGTLGFLHHSAKTVAWTSRPGIDDIEPILRAKGFKIGIFADERLQRQLTEVRTRVKWDVILSRADCFTPEIKRDCWEPGRSKEKFKSLSQHFANTNNVHLVSHRDDNVDPIDRSRVFLIPRYRGRHDDTALIDTIKAISDMFVVAKPPDDDRKEPEPEPEEQRQQEQEWPLLLARFTAHSRHPIGQGLNVTTERLVPRGPGLAGKSIKPLRWRLHDRLLLMGSHMNSGKTYRLRQFVAEMNPKRIVVISPRIQFAQTLMGVLDGFILYSDTQGTLTPGKIIVQYESLHRLSDCEEVDLVIIDEVRSVITQMTSVKTNGDRLAQNYEAFSSLMANAKRVYFSDADLEIDEAVGLLVRRHFVQNEWRFERYIEHSLQRSFVEVPSDAAMISIIRQTFTNAGPENCRVMLCFRSKKKMRAVVATVMAECELESNQVLAISSDTPPEQMTVFQDINHYLQDVKLLAFTSRVTVGADILVAVNKVFAFASGALFGGTSAREIMQMVGRARNVLDTEVCITLPPAVCSEASKKLWAADAHAQMLSCIQANQLDSKIYSEYVSGKVGLRTNALRWMPVALLELAACSALEQTRFFRDSWINILKVGGWQPMREVADHIISHGDAQRLKRRLKQADRQHMAEDEKAAAAVRDHIVAGTSTDAHVDLCFRVTDVLQLFKRECWPDLTGFEIVSLMDQAKRKILLRGQRIADGSLMDEKDDAASMATEAVADVAPRDGAAAQELDRLLKFIGFADGLHDRTSKVLSTFIAQKGAEVVRQGRLIMKLYKLRDRCADESDTAAAAILIVRRLLHHNALTLASERVRVTKKRRIEGVEQPAKCSRYIIQPSKNVGRMRDGRTLDLAHLKAMLIDRADVWFPQ